MRDVGTPGALGTLRGFGDIEGIWGHWRDILGCGDLGTLRGCGDIGGIWGHWGGFRDIGGCGDRLGTFLGSQGHSVDILVSW